MKPKKNYRITGRFKEILDVLMKAKKSRENYFWRAQSRQLVPITIHHIFPEENCIQVSLSKPVSIPLKVNDELYLKLDTRDSAFKTKVQSISPTSFILEFPEEIALSEARLEGRQYFLPIENKMVAIKKNKILANQPKNSFLVSVSNISRNGLELRLKSELSHLLQLNERIILEEVGEYKINPIIFGTIVFKLASEDGVRIGVHLDHKIPKIIFDRFSVREKVVPVTDEKIVRDEKFRVEVHQRMRSISRALRLKKNMSKVFDMMDMRQPEYQYLRLHIQQLCEVMCGLGTRLNWVTEKTMEKLIYIAFVHDARYFTNPKLAMIPSKKALKKLINTLSSEEQTMYLDGPRYVSELAKKDVSSFPDVAKVLAQQKELPDGSGFPYGITAPQFSPLSCLFIVSHYFVDYTMETPDWSITDFVKTHQKFLKGGFFPKVFQAMRT